MEKAALMNDVLREVLRQVKPKDDERKRVLSFVQEMLSGLNKRLSEAGIVGSAQIHGSVAKETWLRGDRDLDIFIVLRRTYSRSVFPRVLSIVKELIGPGWTEAYAEHPYVQAEKEGFHIDFVPCFEMDETGILLSATDRTPLHTGYVREQLPEEMKDEVLLLKQFMHGIRCYGAEVKTSGFSGYLCELLVIHYGSFLGVLRGASEWKQPITIDLKAHYRGKEEEFKKLFGGAPIVVVDPVDVVRNVASAISESKLWLFVAASRGFLESPSRKYFFAPETEAYSEEALRNAIRRLCSDIVFLVLRSGKSYVPDVLWGQLYKAEASLRRLLEKSSFEVLRTAVWSDENKNHVLLFEVEKAMLSRSRLHMGPPVEMRNMGEKFLRKYVGSEITVSGPWIDGRRWWAEVVRDPLDAKSLLEAPLKKDGGVSAGVPKGIAESLERFVVHINEEILWLSSADDGFGAFLAEFLKGRPKWLEVLK